MPKPDKQSDLATKSGTAAAEARDQAVEYDAIFAPRTLELKDGATVSIPPHPTFALLDDDRQEAYEELQFQAESYDRGPEVFVPEQKIKDRSGNDIVLPSITRPGALLVPYRKTNAEGVAELVKPPHSVSVVKAALGDDEYKSLRAGGKGAADVWRIWNEQYRLWTERQQADSKSGGSTVDLAAVPAADSAGSAPVPPAEDS